MVSMVLVSSRRPVFSISSYKVLTTVFVGTIAFLIELFEDRLFFIVNFNSEKPLSLSFLHKRKIVAVEKKTFSLNS
ncbi:hypothetical protein D3C76_1815530 [compost metagenome]